MGAMIVMSSHYVYLNYVSIDDSNNLTYYQPSIIAFRIADFDVTTAGSWQMIKLDSLVDCSGTGSFSFNYDSTKIICNKSGIYSACSFQSLVNNQGSSLNTTAKIRTVHNNVETKCGKWSNQVTRDDGTYIPVNFTGKFGVSSGDSIWLEYNFGDNDLDYESDPAFDKAFTVGWSIQYVTNY